jgi:hypothetical protein
MIDRNPTGTSSDFPFGRFVYWLIRQNIENGSRLSDAKLLAAIRSEFPDREIPQSIAEYRNYCRTQPHRMGAGLPRLDETLTVAQRKEFRRFTGRSAFGARLVDAAKRGTLSAANSTGFLNGPVPTGTIVTVAHEFPGRRSYKLHWRGIWHNRLEQQDLESVLGLSAKPKKKGGQSGYGSQAAIGIVWDHFVNRYNSLDPSIQYSTKDLFSQPNQANLQKIAARLGPKDYASLFDLEGLKTETQVFRTKRSRKLRDAAFVAANGVCCVCDRDFSKQLGGRGKRVLQVHHRDQLSAREVPSLTKLSDLAVVCANCHLLLHLDPKNALKVEDLREMLRADG